MGQSIKKKFAITIERGYWRLNPAARDFGTKNKLNRELWLESTLKKVPPGSRILDAGAGEQQYRRFCAHLEYVSQDFARYNGQGNGVGLQTGAWDQSRIDIISDIAHIPQPDGAFEAVMCIEVLEHVPYPIAALQELVRLLKPGGLLIITAPFCALTHFAPYFYQTGFSRYFFDYWLKEMGMELLDLQLNGSYFSYLAQELRRLAWMGEHYAGGKLAGLERWAVNILLAACARFSKSDTGSNEMLAYGVHVLARKPLDRGSGVIAG